jgi:hypothetical protein
VSVQEVVQDRRSEAAGCAGEEDWEVGRHWEQDAIVRRVG